MSRMVFRLPCAVAMPEWVTVMRGPAPGTGSSPGAGRRAWRSFADSAVLAAVIGGGAGAEQDLLLVPGRIERLEIVGLRIGLGQQPLDHRRVGLRLASGRASAANTAS